PLGAQPLREIREPGHVASGARQTAHQLRPDWIARADHDDGNRWRRSLKLHDRPIAEGRDDVNLETDQLGRQLRKSLETRFRRPGLDDEVLPLDVAEVAEALPKRLQVPRCGGVRVSEMADAPDLRRLLRIAGERQREDAEGEGSGERGAYGHHA